MRFTSTNSLRGFLFAILLASAPPLVAADNPAKLASHGRFDLAADGGAGTLDDGRVLTGGASIERMNWVAEAERLKGFTVSGGISRLGWREFSVRFTPAGSGQVTLTLMGPWEEASPGTIYRQEILWDGFSVAGATLANGGFESGAENKATGWSSNGGAIISASEDQPAAEGRRFARSWHNGTLSATLKVTSQTPVTIRWHARAVTPAGFQDMPRITQRDTPAHRAVKRFQRGANLGNYLEAPRGQDWGAKYTAEDFVHIRAEGFDHVRLPIAWQHYAGPGPDFTLSKEIFQKVDFLVDEALRNKLAVIVNIHHFDDFTSDPAKHGERFHALWRQIAEHYAKHSDSVAFELLNEPKDAATTTALNPIYADAIRRIRRSNPQRTIFVGPGQWNQVRELSSLRLPDDDRNLIVTVHCYDPFYFTHQGATWSGPDTQVTGIRFPGPPDKPLTPDPALKLNPSVRDWLQQYNTLPPNENPSSPRAFRDTILAAQEWSDYYGRPMHLGEFGCYLKADATSRANFYAEFRRTAEAANIGWAIWDWKSGFRYWNPVTNKPELGMHESLFGQSQPAR